MRVLLFLVVCTAPLPSFAAPPSALAPQQSKTGVFTVPAELRPRVDFWIGIFARYGKHNAVLHHRDYPQAIFKVLDFSSDAERLTPSALEKHRERVVKAEAKRIEGIIRSLAAGNDPRDPEERQVAVALSFVPGGASRALIARHSGDPVRAQTGIKERFAQAITRSGRYLPHMEKIFREAGLPIEITRLPFVESSFDYTAYSSVGAAGIWQFMRATGRYYLAITSQIDERRDPIAATKAAARYLEQAYGKLGSWPLAITSYNHGVVGVTRKVKEMGTTSIVRLVENSEKRVFGFASNNFYPEFLAALEVYEQRAKFFPGLRIEGPLRFEEVELPSSVSASFASSQLGVSLATLKELNYAVLPAVWNGRSKLPKGYRLKVPVGTARLANKLRVKEIIAKEPGERATDTVSSNYRVRKGDTLGGIAKRHGLSIAELKEINDLRSDSLRIGQLLKVRVKESSPRSSPSAKKSHEVHSEVKSYRVRKGDTLYRIAERFGTSVTKLKRANSLKTNVLHPGQVIVIE